MPPSKADRFFVRYRLTGDESEARAKAMDLCLEQTVECPVEILAKGFIPDEVVGRLESLQKSCAPGAPAYEALVSFLNDTTGGELTQLCNVLFGNISLKKGFRLSRLEDRGTLWQEFKGPRFGRDGLRALLGQPHRPLLSTAVKPMGLSAVELAGLAGRFSAGGIDVIKDDHGLANQPFASFVERAERCAEAVRTAAAPTGRPILYAPNVTAPAGEVHQRARFAKQVGAGALLICPGLTGLDAMRALADDDSLGLPILAHPAFLGSFAASLDNGISHYALFGQLMRLAGADASIFPHSGGRFGFSLDECREVANGCQDALGNLKSIFPAPGGGMNLQRLPELLEFYGREVMFLVGADLVRNGPDIERNCEIYRRLVERN
ncbi:MAG: RuBisCO large subunit C-terminal-like domain-containing protein [Polyangia bacterium]